MIEAHPVFVVGEVLPGAGLRHRAYHEQTVGSSHEAVEADHAAIGKGQIDSSSHSVSRWPPRRRLSVAGAAPSVCGPPVLPGAVQVNTLTRGIGRPLLLIEDPVLAYRADGNFQHRGLLNSSPRLGAGSVADYPHLGNRPSRDKRGPLPDEDFRVRGRGL